MNQEDAPLTDDLDMIFDLEASPETLRRKLADPVFVADWLTSATREGPAKVELADNCALQYILHDADSDTLVTFRVEEGPGGWARLRIHQQPVAASRRAPTAANTNTPSLAIAA